VASLIRIHNLKFIQLY